MNFHLSLQVKRINNKSPQHFLQWKRLARACIKSRSTLLSEPVNDSDNVPYNNEMLLLSDNDSQKFLETMENPPEPSSVLIDLFK